MVKRLFTCHYVPIFVFSVATWGFSQQSVSKRLLMILLHFLLHVVYIYIRGGGPVVLRQLHNYSLSDDHKDTEQMSMHAFPHLHAA